MREQLYVGLDADWPSLADGKRANRVLGNASALPFRDGSFDVVSSDMVFEHLEEPLDVLRESWRVLSGRGALIVHTASAIHYILMVGRALSSLLPRQTYVRLVARYTGRSQADIFPTRYLANTTGKFSRAVSEAGFVAGFTAALETPIPRRAGPDRLLWRLLPRLMKSTILAVYFKQ
jgi:ubiquinone/menaquinone biosynthesis C-methylase UbiE